MVSKATRSSPRIQSNHPNPAISLYISLSRTTTDLVLICLPKKGETTSVFRINSSEVMMKESERERYRLRFECIHRNKKPKKQSSDCSNGTRVKRPVTEHLVSQSPLSLTQSERFYLRAQIGCRIGLLDQW